jgi:hypothetical protein
MLPTRAKVEGMRVFFCDGGVRKLNPSLVSVPQERKKCVYYSLCSIRSFSFVEGAVSGVRVSAVIVGKSKEVDVDFSGRVSDRIVAVVDAEERGQMAVFP